MAHETKFTLTEDRIPTHWVNLLPDLPGEPLPPLNPGTMQPAGPDDLTPIFPMEIIGQEVSGEPEVEIPEAVRDVYRLWRPTPLYRAYRLERERLPRLREGPGRVTVFPAVFPRTRRFVRTNAGWGTCSRCAQAYRVARWSLLRARGLARDDRAGPGYKQPTRPAWVSVTYSRSPTASRASARFA